MVEFTWRAVRPGLCHFPGYAGQLSGPGYEHLLQGLTYEKFLSGAVPSLFHGEWDGEDQFAQPRFVNFSLRENLAFLHIANVFLLAYNGSLETTPEAVEAYGNTVELLAAKQLQRITVFFDLISEDSIRSILRRGPKEEVQSPLSRFLAGQIGACFCEYVADIRKDGTISFVPWHKSMVSAFHQMEREYKGPLKTLIEHRLGLAYIYGQVLYAKSYRVKGQYAQAEQCADQVLRFQRKHKWIVNSDGYPMKANILLEQVRQILNGEHRGKIHPVQQSDLALAFQLTEELGSLSNQSSWKNLAALSPEQNKLAPIFLMMLERAKHKWSAYAAQEFFHSSALEYVCSASYLAKAYCVIAALSPGNSGMAYNLLGSMAENDDEVLENDRNLPFFKENPGLHLDIPDLQYQENHVASFRIYQQIYNVRRGSQPYSARRLCESLLRRQVRLDQEGEPVPADGAEPFTERELELLNQATLRTSLKKESSGLYWRARFLHELAVWDNNSEQFEFRLRNAQRALRAVWDKNSCTRKLTELEKGQFDGVDFLSVLIILEDLLLNQAGRQEQRDLLYSRIFEYLRYCWIKLQTKPRYTTGSRVTYSDLQSCILHIDRLKTDGDSFIVKHMKPVCQFLQ